METAFGIAEKILHDVPTLELLCRPDLSAVEELEKFI